MQILQWRKWSRESIDFFVSCLETYTHYLRKKPLCHQKKKNTWSLTDHVISIQGHTWLELNPASPLHWCLVFMFFHPLPSQQHASSRDHAATHWFGLFNGASCCIPVPFVARRACIIDDRFHFFSFSRPSFAVHIVWFPSPREYDVIVLLHSCLI